MAEKLTITVPDDLFKRLQVVKNEFNVSRVCQEAIRREVNRQELLSKGNGKMNDVIKRLKLEKKEYDTKYESQGYNDGYETAKEMHYTELKEFAQFNERTLTLDGKKAPWSFPAGASLVSNKFLLQVNQNFEDDFDDAKTNDLYLNEKDYREGWLKGIKAFWEKIKDKL